MSCADGGDDSGDDIEFLATGAPDCGGGGMIKAVNVGLAPPMSGETSTSSLFREFQQLTSVMTLEFWQ